VKICLVFLFLSAAILSASAQYPLYHRLSDTAGAAAEAQARHLPVAYIGVLVPELSNPQSITMAALSSLQGVAVVICFDAHSVAKINPMIRAQYGIRDDGEEPGSANTWMPPKIVFTDPAITKVVGRVASTQIQANPQIIFQVLGNIRDNPDSLNPAPMPLAASTPAFNSYPIYHAISDTAAAQAEASARHLPLAYLGSHDGELTRQSPPVDSEEYLSQMALTALQGKAVVIYFEGSNMAPVPMFVHMQYHVPDDGVLEGGAAWMVPKVVFADPGLTKTLGRVSATQMRAGHETAFASALAAINTDTGALTSPPSPASKLSPASASSPPSTSMPDLSSLASNPSAWMPAIHQYVEPFVMTHQLYCGIGMGVFVLIVLYRLAGRLFGSE
jgi:hypothetical protein